MGPANSEQRRHERGSRSIERWAITFGGAGTEKTNEQLAVERKVFETKERVSGREGARDRQNSNNFTNSEAPREEFFIACATHKRKRKRALKSNQGMRRRFIRCARGRKQMVVESQPAAKAAVSGDPHEEEFDFGPHIGVALQQQAAGFKVAVLSRVMQWGVLTEEKQKNQRAQSEFRFVKTRTIMRREKSLIISLHIGVALQQQAAGFKVAVLRRVMQWGPFTAKQQKN